MLIQSVKGFEAMCGSLTGLTIIAVTLRFVARKKNKLPLMSDDWSMLAALGFFLGNMITVVLLARLGLCGYNSDPASGPPDPNTIPTQEIITAFDCITIWTLGTAKAAALFLYKRIFCPDRKHNPVLYIMVVITLVIVACWIITFFFLALFQCHTNFDYGPSHFKFCTLLNQYDLGFYISDIILDVWVMLLPIPYIMRLHMKPLKKWSISIIFMLSFVGLGASIGRLANNLQTKPPSPGNNKHFSGGSGHQRSAAYTPYFWFGVLEMGTNIIAINLPVLYGLFSKTGPEIILRLSRSITSLTSRRTFSSHSSNTSDAGENLHARRGSTKSEETEDTPKEFAHRLRYLGSLDFGETETTAEAVNGVGAWNMNRAEEAEAELEKGKNTSLHHPENCPLGGICVREEVWVSQEDREIGRAS